MSKRSTLLRASVAVAGAALAATAAALDPQQFVAGWPIEAPAGAEVFDVPLTAEVYAAASSIEQLAVLDANGEPQSFFRRGVAPARADRAARRARGVAAVRRRHGAAPSVGVTTSERGTSVTVTPGASGAPAITGFVLDARAVEAAPVALELDWRALPQPFLLDVGVEQSTDLTNWRSVGAGVRRRARDRRRRGAARARARARESPAATSASRRAAASPIGTCCARRSSSARPSPSRRSSVRVPPLAAARRARGRARRCALFRRRRPAAGVVRRARVRRERRLGARRRRGEPLARRAVDAGRVRRAVLRAVVRRPRVRERAARRRSPRRALLACRCRRRRCAASASSSRSSSRRSTCGSRPRGGAPYLLAAGTLAEEAGPDATLASVWSALDPRRRTRAARDARRAPRARRRCGARRGAALPVAHGGAVGRADRGRACRRERWRLDSRRKCAANRPEVCLASRIDRSDRSFAGSRAASRSSACFGSRCRSAPSSRCVRSTRRRRW